MGAQRFYRTEIARQFRLAQRRVDLVVANLVEKNRWPTFAAPQFGNQMMQALTRLGRNGPLAQGTDWIGQSDQSTIGPLGTMPNGLRNSDGEK